jgi:hypothetical protein
LTKKEGKYVWERHYKNHTWSVRRGYIGENLKIVISYDDCKDSEYFWISGSIGSAAIFGS